MNAPKPARDLPLASNARMRISPHARTSVLRCVYRALAITEVGVVATLSLCADKQTQEHSQCCCRRIRSARLAGLSWAASWGGTR